jgi:hypothetical protein
MRHQLLASRRTLRAKVRQATDIHDSPIEPRETAPLKPLYLVRDGDRTIWLATEHNGRLYVYVANLNTFVRNNPLSLDYLIDRNHTYQRIDLAEATKVMNAGRVGRIDPRWNGWLIEHFRNEPDQLQLDDVLGTEP